MSSQDLEGKSPPFPYILSSHLFLIFGMIFGFQRTNPKKRLDNDRLPIKY